LDEEEKRQDDEGSPRAGLGGFLADQYRRGGWPKMLLLLAVTAAVLGSLLYRVDLDELAGTVLGADPVLLVLAALVAVLVPVSGSLRWRAALAAAGEDVPLWTCIRVYYAALPANVLTPSKAGDLLRSVFLRKKVEPWKGTGVILTERLVDVSVLSTMALLGSLSGSQWAIAGVAGAILALCVGVFLAANLSLPLPSRWRDSRWAARMAALAKAARALARKPTSLLAVVGGSVLNWCMNLGVATLCFQALGVAINPVLVAGTLPIAIFVGLLPVTLSGMGTRDSAIVWLFAHVAGGASEAACLGVGLLYSLLLYWLLALVGLPFLRWAIARRGSG